MEYFVSYFDYYQPEAYIPRTDTFIEKDSSINEEIERLRLSTMSSLLTRRDVIVVASVSCIYGIGSKENYEALIAASPRRDGDFARPIALPPGGFAILPQRRRLRARPVPRARRRGGTAPLRDGGRAADGVFRRGNRAPQPLRSADRAKTETPQSVIIFPAKQFVTPERKSSDALLAIREEMGERIAWFEARGKLLEAQRIKMRTEYDLEMMEEMGFCSGIENYSRHLAARPPGSRPGTLLDFFPRITC